MEKDYKNLPENKLRDVIIDFRKRIISTYSLLDNPREKRENRGKLRREIARIETELSRRKNELTK